MRVLAALSGGVDSTVAASLLLEAGHEVLGGSLRLCDRPGGDDPAPAEAAASLGIPFFRWDARARFEERVVAPFAAAYAAGRTPNPCALCNPRVKFALLLERARELGAERLATGHYARIAAGPAGAPRLLRGADRGKDQSYFLFGLERAWLGRILFPLGGLTKGEVRRLARERSLAVAERPESQEICFVPEGDAGAFAAARLPAGAGGPGAIVDRAGRRLGTHRGLAHYTVGQRRGLGFAAGSPRYVLALDAAANAVVVGAEGELWGRELSVAGVNWLVDPPAGAFRAAVRIRSRHEPSPALLETAGEGGWRVRFDEPQRALTPGQAAVLYDGDSVLGGGWIEG